MKNFTALFGCIALALAMFVMPASAQTDYTSFVSMDTNGITDESGVTSSGWTSGTSLNVGTYADATFTATASDGRSALMAETYGNNTVCHQIYQTVSGLETGVYEVQVYAASLNAWGVSSLTGSADDVAYVYAIGGGLETQEFITAMKADTYGGAGYTSCPGPYTISNINVTDGNIEFGLGIAKAGQTHWHTIQIYSLVRTGDLNVDLSTYVEAYGNALTEAKELAGQKMSNEALAALNEAIAAEVDQTDMESLTAAISKLSSAVAAAKASASAYESNKAAIDVMYKILDETNVYTQEAYETYKGIADGYLAEYEAGTLTETVPNHESLLGWHVSNTVDDLLLSTWSIGGTQCSEYTTSLYINTWSVEGQTDGSGVLVPFFEYWTGDASFLGDNELTSTLTGLEPGTYDVKVLARVRLSNSATDAPTGITLTVNDGEGVDVCAGTQSETMNEMYYGTYTARGVVGEDGVLTIKLTVANANVSWIAFKNVKYSPVYETSNLDFSAGTVVDNGDGICTYDYDMEKTGATRYSLQDVEGWTQNSTENARAGGLIAYGSTTWLGGTDYVAPATNPDEEAAGNALAVLAVWGATSTYTQKVTLDPGNYVITIPVYNVGGAEAVSKNLTGFIAEDGTEYLSTTSKYTVGAWTTETITFTLTETTTGDLSLGYAAQNAGSGKMPHLFFDKVNIATVSDAELAKADLESAIAAATSTSENATGIGDGLFEKPQTTLDELNAAIDAAQVVFDNADATVEEVNAAIETLNAAVETFENASITLPEEGKKYTFQQETSGLYLNIAAVTTTDEDGVETTTNLVTIGENPEELWFVYDEEGNMYLTNGTEYVGTAGTDTWSMSSVADNKCAVTGVSLGDGKYAIGTPLGYIGTDGTTAGSYCYADKKTTDANSVWVIAEVSETENVIYVDGVAVPVAETITVTAEAMEKTQYEGVTAEFDLAAVLAALGIDDITTAQQYIINCTDLSAVENTTDGWRNAEGDMETWGTSAGMVCVKLQDPASGLIDYIGCIDATYSAGDTYTAKWGFVANGKAVVLDVVLTFISSTKGNISEFDDVTTIAVDITEMPNTAYSGSTAEFDLNAVLEALGISDINEADLYICDVTTGALHQNTTDGWRNAEGDMESWNSSTGMVCVKLSDPSTGILDYIGCIDDTHNEGDTFKCKWVFVANGKAVVLDINILFTDPTATGINTVDAADLKDSEIFDLSGRRVNNISKGGVYIMNRKKVFVK